MNFDNCDISWLKPYNCDTTSAKILYCTNLYFNSSIGFHLQYVVLSCVNRDERGVSLWSFYLNLLTNFPSSMNLFPLLSFVLLFSLVRYSRLNLRSFNQVWNPSSFFQSSLSFLLWVRCDVLEVFRVLNRRGSWIPAPPLPHRFLSTESPFG